MSFITMTQAISSVVGGVPVMPAGGKTIIENLRAAKSMIPGEMSGVLGKLLNGGGVEAIMKNPIGALQGSLSGQLSGLTGSLTSALGGSGPLSGLGNISGVLGSLTGPGGLNTVVGNLGQVSSALSGLIPAGTGVAQFGLLDAIGHSTMTQLIGSSLPSNLSLASAMGPIMMGDALTVINAKVGSTITGLNNGTIGSDAAIATFTGVANQIQGVLDTSHNAFSTVQAQAVNIAQTLAVVSMVSADAPGMTDIAKMIIRDDVKPEIQAAMDAQVAMPAPTTA